MLNLDFRVSKLTYSFLIQIVHMRRHHLLIHLDEALRLDESDHLGHGVYVGNLSIFPRDRVYLAAHVFKLL